MARTNKDRSEAMREALIESGRALFFAKGYAETGTPEIVATAKVTRGALYHHFKDKKDLFRAIVEIEAADVAHEIFTMAKDITDPLDAFMAGAEAYFNTMQKPGRVQVLLIDGLNVLGREALDEIDAKTGEHELQEGLKLALEHKDVSPASIAAMSKMLSSAFDRAALEIYEGAETKPFLKGIKEILKGLIR